MKILFISPAFESNKSRGLKPFIYSYLYKIFLSPSLSFQILAALTPYEYSIKYVNEEYKKINFNEDCDLVGITSTTINANHAYQIADEFRKRGVKVVIGGWHPSVLPNEAKEHADSVVIGEAEDIWPKLLRDFKNKDLKAIYKQNKPVDLNKIPFPDKKRLKYSEGLMVSGIQATRGCTKGCKYCSITNSPYGRIFRVRPIETVIKEIGNIRQKILYFCDSSLTLNPEYSKELFKSMIDLNKKFYCNGNIDVLSSDEELIKLASKAGCVEWSIGFESISQKSLDFIGKKTNKVENFKSAIEKIHDHGMGIKGNFIFGFDEDRLDIFTKTLDAIYDWKLDSAEFNILIPFPGTPLFKQLQKEQRILTYYWPLYDCSHVVFQPKHMTAQELLSGTIEINKKFHSKYNIINRSLNCFRHGFYSFLTTGVENIFKGLFHQNFN